MKYRMMLTGMLLGTATLACSIFVGGPTYPVMSTPSPTEGTQELQAQIEQAVAASTQTGDLKLELDENQLTAYITSSLAAQPDPLISEPRVLLRDGIMRIYGQAQSGIFTANVGIAAQFSVDEAGEPQISITEADFGPFPAPEGLKEAISAFLHETLAGSLGPVAIGFRLERIDIADGVMTVTGRVR